jgi:hypothetical protein
MKKLINYLLLFYPLVLICSCGNGAGENPAEHTDTLTAVPEMATPTQPVANKARDEKFDYVSKMNTFRIECAGSDVCGDAACQEEIATLHNTGYTTFRNYVKNFYLDEGIDTPNIPEPYTMTRQQMIDLTNVDCATSRIRFNLALGDISTHSNITLIRASGWARPANETSSYSIALFKGILNRGADSFAFYRGLKGTLKTLAVAAFDVEKEPVFYGDLSDTYPYPVDIKNHKKKYKKK